MKKFSLFFVAIIFSISVVSAGSLFQEIKEIPRKRRKEIKKEAKKMAEELKKKGYSPCGIYTLRTQFQIILLSVESGKYDTLSVTATSASHVLALAKTGMLSREHLIKELTAEGTTFGDETKFNMGVDLLIVIEKGVSAERKERDGGYTSYELKIINKEGLAKVKAKYSKDQEAPN